MKDQGDGTTRCTNATPGGGTRGGRQVRHSTSEDSLHYQCSVRLAVGTTRFKNAHHDATGSPILLAAQATASRGFLGTHLGCGSGFGRGPFQSAFHEDVVRVLFAEGSRHGACVDEGATRACVQTVGLHCRDEASAQGESRIECTAEDVRSAESSSP